MAVTPVSKVSNLAVDRMCLRPPIPEIALAASYLDQAVSAHIAKEPMLCQEMLQKANMTEIRAWTESLWGKASPHVQYRPVPGAPPTLEKSLRGKDRMPTLAEKKQLHIRDGYHCRFCEIPVIRSAVRDRLRKLYPDVMPWPKTNTGAHAAFQAMWAQYDHVLPHARGGNNSFENMVVTCAPCNFARMNFTLDEVGLADPSLRKPLVSTWDGLERILHST